KVFANTTAATLTAENVTVHYCTNFFGNTSGAVNLTNCLFACVTNWQCAATGTNCNAILLSDGGVFQTIGGGRHYLADQSAYRNAGTTNIYPKLLAGLSRKTTYPPIMYSNVLISVDTTFNPQAQRDFNTPDLGYHYDPLDYLFCAVNTTNASTV